MTGFFFLYFHESFDENKNHDRIPNWTLSISKQLTTSGKTKSKENLKTPFLVKIAAVHYGSALVPFPYSHEKSPDYSYWSISPSGKFFMEI